jgi:type VI secretion system protein ImpG
VCLPTSHSPEFADFRNIHAITANLLPPVGRGGNLLWRLLSHLSLNYASLSSGEHLRSLLELYTFLSSRDRTIVQANRKRVAGIESLETKISDRLVSGIMMRGRQIILAFRHDHFAGPGDLYLFGCVLDYFLGSYASINSFTELLVKETLRGDQYRWPARMGDRPLI